MSKQKKWLVMIAGAACLAGGAFLAVVSFLGPFYRDDLRVTVENVGDMEFAAVRVDVRGGSQELGRISPGREASATFQIGGESGVKVTVTDLTGAVTEFGPLGYFEPVNVGDVVFKIKNNLLISVRETTFPNGSSYLQGAPRGA